jgi:hypothetical protein
LPFGALEEARSDPRTGFIILTRKQRQTANQDIHGKNNIAAKYIMIYNLKAD